MRVLVGIPCFNEAENLPELIRELDALRGQYDFLVVDDASRDQTYRIARDAGLTVTRHSVNLGGGGAVKTAILCAARQEYDAFVQLDGDGQHDPRQIETLLEPIRLGKTDLVIGSRFLNGIGFQSTFSRRMGIKIFSRLVTAITGRRITDLTSGFKAFGRSFLALMATEYCADFPDISPILVAHFAGFRAIEVPVTMRMRRHGDSEFDFFRTLRYPLNTAVGIAGTLLQRTRIRALGRL